MPFTPSHAVVALPFVRTPLVPAAVAIGAMTPDLALFTRGIGVTYGFLHAVPNLLWTSLIAAVLLLIWRVVLRPASVELVPAAVAARLPDEWRTRGADAARDTFVRAGRPWYPMLLLVSLMIGVLSHILWDSFTHEGRWGVQLLPFLKEPWGSLLGYKWLQYGSGLFGLIVLAVYAAVWLRRQPVHPPAQTVPRWLPAVWIGGLPVLLAGALGVGYAVWGPFTAEFTPAHLAYRTLPPVCGLWGAATFVLCVVLILRTPVRAASATR
ncbi:DUF4184 family protein [Microbacterium bovistercoris]|uniref:DUF4184 family protein n=1 Tax=Microbacterium bovistercoris TaxID=2293570 RepID=A0A371NRM4_9MICO|nr:DUF4184 family protein [Microbacterium bovistercoris]REJ04407.1 DUF4184 family protein [Microbacterium bovistercoris]